MKIAIKISIIYLIVTQTLSAQYNLSPDAPINPVPIKFHKDHFFLKGQVKFYKVKDTNYKHEVNYLFDKKGFLTEKIVGDKNSRISPKIIYLYENGTFKGTQYTRFGKAMDTITVEVDNQNRPITEKFSGGYVQYQYDSKGNYIAKYIVNNGNKHISNKYEYDKKNRLIKEWKYLDETPTYSINHSYQIKDKYLKVTTISTEYGYTPKIDTTVAYYLNGHYIGKNKNYKIKFDKNNNPYNDKKGHYQYTYYTNKAERTADKTKTTEGKCYGNCQNGWGTKEYKNGKYRGFWLDGLKQGYGKFVWNNGTVYQGQWKEDKMDGLVGVLLKGQTAYYGGFRNGKFYFRGITTTNDTTRAGWYNNGELSFTYPFEETGNKTGCTKGDCNNGFGQFVWENNDKFLGFWLEGKMSMGFYYFANGDIYFGYFNDKAQFNMFGFYRYKTGEEYIGEYYNGKKEGKGYLKNANGSEQIGIWEDDKLIKSFNFRI